MREKANHYIYFVSYSLVHATGSGFGNVEMTMGAPITMRAQLDAIRDWIEENLRGNDGMVDPSVVILNYIFMHAE